MTAGFGLAGAPAGGLSHPVAPSGYREVHRPTSVSASYHGVFERLERLDGKLSRAVPRGRRAGNGPLLPDQTEIKFRPLSPNLKIEQSRQEARQLWDDAADTFDNEPDHGLRDPVVREAWTHLLARSLPAPPASVLDIGCGTGSLSLVLAGLNYDVTGSDLSETMIARAKAKAKAAGYTIPFMAMDAFNPDFSGQQFDVILCRHMLWALSQPALALQRWSKILVPGGRLLLIEGYWHTGAGLQAHQIVEMLPATFASVNVKNLSDQTDLWGGDVTDERYIVIADQSEPGRGSAS